MTTNIVALNGAATPVSKTFTVARSAVGDESAVLYVREGANQTAFPKLEFSTKNGTSAMNRKARTGVVTIVIPYGILDANGVFTKIDHASATIRLNTPDDCPQAIRDDLAAYVNNVPADAQIKGIVKLGYAT